jgi:hypothetical protein
MTRVKPIGWREWQGGCGFFGFELFTRNGILGQLHLNRPSDQLSPRTPPAIVYPDRSRGVYPE